MWTMTAGFLGGMGLFFAGLKITGNGVRSLAGRRFRERFQHCTANTPSAGALGFFSGMLFQSVSGLTILLASLIGVGAATVRNALPVILGANAGMATLVLIAVVDIRILILAALGMAGLILSFERPARLVNAAWIVFGVCLILFGLQIVRDSAAPMAQLPWFRDLLTSTGLSLPLSFAIGVLAALILQTAAGVSILAITMADSGLVAPDSALALIYGSLLGSSILTRFYAIQLTGARKRLAMGQVLFNLTGLIIYLPICVAEGLFGIPLLQALSAHLFPDIDHQLTFMRILFDSSTAIILLVGLPCYLRLLERLFPDDPSENQALLANIRELSGFAPDTAMLAVNKVQTQLVALLPRYTDNLRGGLENGQEMRFKGLHADIDALLKAIDENLHDIAGNVLTTAQATCLHHIQNFQSMLLAVNNQLKGFVRAVASGENQGPLNDLAHIFLESLDMFLGLMAETVNSTDEEQWLQFMELCQDRGETMEKLRARYLVSLNDSSEADRTKLMRLTSLYEQLIWIIRHAAASQADILHRLRGLAIEAVPTDDETTRF